MTTKQKPLIFEYDDYREFLKDMFKYLKLHRRGFSYRNFTKESGISSAGFLTLVMESKRNLSSESITKFSKGLRLNKQESEYFESLVLFNQARTNEEKNRYFEKLSKNRKYREIRLLETNQFKFFSKWYYSAVRELIHLKTFQEDLRWISKTLVPKITEKQAKEALELLQTLGLVKRSEDGILQTCEVNISSGAEVASLSVKNYHHQMIHAADRALELIPGNERDISAVILTSSEEKLSEIKNEIREFRKKLLSLASEEVSKHDRVYQLNMQFFPLSKSKDSL